MTHREMLVKIYEDLAALDKIHDPEKRQPAVDDIIRQIDGHLMNEQVKPKRSLLNIWVIFMMFAVSITVVLFNDAYPDLTGFVHYMAVVGVGGLVWLAINLLEMAVTLLRKTARG